MNYKLLLVCFTFLLFTVAANISLIRYLIYVQKKSDGGERPPIQRKSPMEVRRMWGAAIISLLTSPFFLYLAIKALEGQ